MLHLFLVLRIADPTAAAALTAALGSEGATASINAAIVEVTVGLTQPFVPTHPTYVYDI